MSSSPSPSSSPPTSYPIPATPTPTPAAPPFSYSEPISLYLWDIRSLVMTTLLSKSIYRFCSSLPSSIVLSLEESISSISAWEYVPWEIQTGF
ncbi:hypothetical protein Tco_0162488 [Tanacetum coccineum]